MTLIQVLFDDLKKDIRSIRFPVQSFSLGELATLFLSMALDAMNKDMNMINFTAKAPVDFGYVIKRGESETLNCTFCLPQSVFFGLKI